MTIPATKKTIRKAYIRLLSDASAQISDAELCGELIEAGYIDGDALRDEDGRIDGAVGQAITVSGRLLLQSLLQQEREESWLHKTWGIVLLIGSYVFGAISPFLYDVLKHFAR